MASELRVVSIDTIPWSKKGDTRPYSTIQAKQKRPTNLIPITVEMSITHKHKLKGWFGDQKIKGDSWEEDLLLFNFEYSKQTLNHAPLNLYIHAVPYQSRGFSPKWIRWIRSLVQSESICVWINDMDSVFLYLEKVLGKETLYLPSFEPSSW